MGYHKIPNLYQDATILNFKECYAMEKIHGTSAHITWKNGAIQLSSGGSKHSTFQSIFDLEILAERFKELGYDNIIVYGEAYGGKEQGMKHTYGDKLRFCVFEVCIGRIWLSVINAESVSNKLGLEFVPYCKGPCTVEWLDEQRDLPSRVSKRRGIVEDKISEGIVIRPLYEFSDNQGKRVIAKYKRPEFSETKTYREIDPEKIKVLDKARDIADEWVTDMRMTHVLSKLMLPYDFSNTSIVIQNMIHDIKDESHGEIVWSKAAERCIGAKTASMYRHIVNNQVIKKG